uniref:Ig-like domain-containing protein n=1 Tax=Oreochromis aureus TaxID=47969 RepID=A0A668V198_OREAU
NDKTTTVPLLFLKHFSHRLLLLGYTILIQSCIVHSDSFNLAALLVSLSDPNIITAESGQNVTLPCRWSRADFEPKHVLVYRGENFVPDEQHPSFKDRVDLQDRQMKDGDVSLILKDVTINDTGTYECRVLMGETRSWKSISSIYLSVKRQFQD